VRSSSERERERFVPCLDQKKLMMFLGLGALETLKGAKEVFYFLQLICWLDKLLIFGVPS